MDLQGWADHLRIVICEPGDKRIGIAHLDHQGAKDVRFPHQLGNIHHADAFALAQFVICLFVRVELLKPIGIDHLRLVLQPEGLQLLIDHAPAPDQDWRGNSLFLELIGGADDLLLFALGKRDPLGPPRGARLVLEKVPYLFPFALTIRQLFTVLVDIDRLSSDACLHCHPGNGGRFPQQHARIKRLWDDVFTSELNTLPAIGTDH